jgi:hypothetical protein
VSVGLDVEVPILEAMVEQNARRDPICTYQKGRSIDNGPQESCHELFLRQSVEYSEKVRLCLRPDELRVMASYNHAENSSPG